MYKSQITKRGFSLAEMLVVILILSIVAAAAAPIVTKRFNVSQDAVAMWQLATNNKDIYTTHRASIGTSSVPTSDSMLTINVKSLTYYDNEHPIIFTQANGAILPTNYLVMVGGNTGLGGDNYTKMESGSTWLGYYSACVGMYDAAFGVNASVKVYDDTISISQATALGYNARVGQYYYIGGDCYYKDVGAYSCAVGASARTKPGTAFGYGALTQGYTYGMPSAYNSAFGNASQALSWVSSPDYGTSTAFGKSIKATSMGTSYFGSNTGDYYVDSTGNDYNAFYFSSDFISGPYYNKNTGLGYQIYFYSNRDYTNSLTLHNNVGMGSQIRISGYNNVLVGRNASTANCISGADWSTDLDHDIVILGGSDGSASLKYGSVLVGPLDYIEHGTYGELKAVTCAGSQLGVGKNADKVVAMGSGSYVNGSESVLVGSNSYAGSDYVCGDTVIGSKANCANSEGLSYIDWTYHTIFGSGARIAAKSYKGTVFGANAKSIAPSVDAQVYQAFGANANGSLGVAFGYNTSPGSKSTCVGASTSCSGFNFNGVYYQGSNNVNIGAGIINYGCSTNALGYCSKVELVDSYTLGGISDAIGAMSTVSAYRSIALGYSAHTTIQDSIAIGTGATSYGNSVTFGTDAEQKPLVASENITAKSGNMNAIAFSTTSDIRLKNVKGEFVDGLDKIRKIEPYNFTFKKDKKHTPHTGVIAQDLQKIFPNSVEKGRDGYLTINQEEMFYAAINSIKQLDTMIQSLVAKFDDISKCVANIVDRINKIDAILKPNDAKNKLFEIKMAQNVAKNKQLEVKIAQKDATIKALEQKLSKIESKDRQLDAILRKLENGTKS